MFQAILSNLMARVKGAQWAMVVGMDGVLLQVNPPALVEQKETLAAEYGLFFRACQRVSHETGRGDLRRYILVTDHGKIIAEFLTPEYVLLMGLDREGHAGRALFEITRSRGALEQELVF